MGRLHARVYTEMEDVNLVGVYDANHAKAEAVAEEYGCKAFGNLRDLLPHVAGASVCVPTKYHGDLAEPFLHRGVACLIEKPLAKDVFDARKIVEASHRYEAIVQVGHIERFNPAIRAMQRLNIQPRFIEVTRVSPLTFRSIDVGVVLDMMIHDIDIVLRLANSAVAKIDAVGVSVIGEVEDICNARITFENGCVANLTASRLSLKTERKLRVFSADAYVSLDYQKKHGVFARRSGNVDAIRDVVSKIRSGEIDDISQLKFDELINIEELEIDDIEPLRAELESFVEAVANKGRPAVTAEEGMAAVEVATRIVEHVKGSKLA
jgi:predicted dehydrogenase